VTEATATKISSREYSSIQIVGFGAKVGVRPVPILAMKE
jgi:hypothetical protein